MNKKITVGRNVFWVPEQQGCPPLTDGFRIVKDIPGIIIKIKFEGYWETWETLIRPEYNDFHGPQKEFPHGFEATIKIKIEDTEDEATD